VENKLHQRKWSILPLLIRSLGIPAQVKYTLKVRDKEKKILKDYHFDGTTILQLKKINYSSCPKLIFFCKKKSILNQKS